MMGRSHATMGATGWLAGCVLVQACGYPVDTAAVVIGAAVCAGWALAPDLDHPESTVSQSVGPITRLLARIVAFVGVVVHEHTRTNFDRPNGSGHRTWTHTALWAAVWGLIAASAGRWGGPWTAAVFVYGAVHIGLQTALPAKHRTWRVTSGFKTKFARSWTFKTIFGKGGQRFARDLRRLPVPVPTMLAACAAFTAYQLAPHSVGWLGLAVGAGAFLHCLGDALTNSACPLASPIPIPVVQRNANGDRVIAGWRVWYPIGPPKCVRFDTGGKTETEIVVPLLSLAGCAAAVKLAWPVIAPLWHALAAIAESLTAT